MIIVIFIMLGGASAYVSFYIIAHMHMCVFLTHACFYNILS